MFQTFKNAFKIESLRQKILFTIFMVAIIRLGFNIPVPGINAEALSETLNKFGEATGILDMISGGGLGTMAIFGLGILPYINASIIMQLLTVAIPALEKVSKEEDGRKKINQITRYAAIVLSAVQAFGIVYAFRFQTSSSGIPFLKSQSILTYIVAIVTMVAGTSILIWIGEKITENGLGNGISLIIFLNILSRMPQTFYMLGKVVDDSLIYMGIIAVFLAIIAFVVLVQEGERRIPVEYAKRVSGRRVAGGGSSSIPIKVNLSGVMPVIFASSLTQVPGAITKFVQASGNKVPDFLSTMVTWLSYKHPFGAALYILLILFFAYFYTTIQFNPIQFADNLKKSGGVIAGVRPGEPTVKYITKVLNYITLVGATFLAIIAVVPVVIQLFLNGANIYFGGTSLLIAVGVALETVKQMEAHMLVRQYKGFLA